MFSLSHRFSTSSLCASIPFLPFQDLAIWPLHQIWVSVQHNSLRLILLSWRQYQELFGPQSRQQRHGRACSYSQTQESLLRHQVRLNFVLLQFSLSSIFFYAIFCFITLNFLLSIWYSWLLSNCQKECVVRIIYIYAWQELKLVNWDMEEVRQPWCYQLTWKTISYVKVISRRWRQTIRLNAPSNFLKLIRYEVERNMTQLIK